MKAQKNQCYLRSNFTQLSAKIRAILQNQLKKQCNEVQYLKHLICHLILLIPNNKNIMQHCG